MIKASRPAIKHFFEIVVISATIIALTCFALPTKTYATVYSAAYYSVKSCEYRDTAYTVGNSVYFLQQLLTNFGYYSGGVDGDFGTVTRSAVYSYQYANGLTVDGQVGFYTWGELLVDGELSTSFSCRNIGRGYGLCLYETKETSSRCVYYRVDNSAYTTLYY